MTIFAEGPKVRMRIRTEDDHVDEGIWAQDGEVYGLDPSVSHPILSVIFSLETIDGKHIGLCIAYDWSETDIQIGIRIGDKDYWNQGYGTEAVNLLTEYCFVLLNKKKVWLKVLPENVRAIRCYEKCGFVRTGKLSLGGYEFITMEKKVER